MTFCQLGDGRKDKKENLVHGELDGYIQYVRTLTLAFSQVEKKTQLFSNLFRYISK